MQVVQNMNIFETLEITSHTDGKAGRYSIQLLHHDQLLELSDSRYMSDTANECTVRFSDISEIAIDVLNVHAEINDMVRRVVVPPRRPHVQRQLVSVDAGRLERRLEVGPAPVHVAVVSEVVVQVDRGPDVLSVATAALG